VEAVLGTLAAAASREGGAAGEDAGRDLAIAEGRVEGVADSAFAGGGEHKIDRSVLSYGTFRCGGVEAAMFLDVGKECFQLLLNLAGLAIRFN
jgi:hypothetical protein